MNIPTRISPALRPSTRTPAITRRAGLVAALSGLATLAACSGIPLRSLPRLMKLEQQLLDANPAEFALALQVDARMVPPPGAVPRLNLAIKPAVPGAFEPVDKQLPMRIAVSAAATQGLAPALPGRRWLIYDLPPESQAELQRVQNLFRKLRAESSAGKGGGSVAIGIAQEGLAVRDSALAGTRWESWLRTARDEGFYELWSGTVRELLERASGAGR